MALPMDQCHWMNPGVRTAIISARPWSLPASLTPLFLTACVLHFSQGATPTLAFAACVVCILCVHAAANLTNTYFDFKNGVDKKETADDRGIVDGNVGDLQAIQAALALFSVGGLAMLAVALSSSTQAFYVGATGISLAFFYTAAPVNLKGHALGELTIFLCFGPLASALASLSIVRTVDPMVLLLSVPMGLLTVAILHANNTRDIAVDQAANVTTIAQWLTPKGNLYLYYAQIGLSYALVASFAALYTSRLLMVAACLPWSIHLCTCFNRNALGILPQLTAQHNLLFGSLCCFALLPPMFLARLLLACLFYMGGANNIIMWSYNVFLVHEKMNAIIPVSLGMSKIMFAAAIITQMASAVCFIFGYECRLMAQIMLCWLVPVTLAVHNFWTIPDEAAPDYLKTKKGPMVAQRTVPTFPTEFDNEFVHFFKNVGMIGGLVVFLEAGL